MLTYNLTERNGTPKYEYLYQCIRQDILRGFLLPGHRLPSKRTLAEHLGCSVVTVDGAYQQLAEEGYILAKERSGFYVSAIHPLPEITAPAPVLHLCQDPEAPPPDTEFRFSALSKIMRRVITDHGEKLLQKPPHSGCAILRNAIAEYLLRYRGFVAQPEQIVIGSGTEYLYGLLVQLLGRDRIFGLENPSYEKIRAVYEANGVQCKMLDLDQEGIPPAVLERSGVDVLHTTPFHSYPTNITAPVQRRIEYLRWAKQYGGYIIEDDFASEFSPRSRPVETIFQLDRTGRVIYLNTFSKSLAPSMRMGYMVLPKRLMADYQRKLGFYSCTVPVFDQYVLAEYISEGHFERHLSRIRRKLQNQKTEKAK